MWEGGSVRGNGVCVPAASSAFCIIVSRQRFSTSSSSTHVFGISHVCDLSKWLDSELRWCRGVVVGCRSSKVGGRELPQVRVPEAKRAWRGPCTDGVQVRVARTTFTRTSTQNNNANIMLLVEAIDFMCAAKRWAYLFNMLSIPSQLPHQVPNW